MNQARLLDFQNFKKCQLSECCKNGQDLDLHFRPFSFAMHKCFLSAPIPQASLDSLYLYFFHYCIMLKKYDLRSNHNQGFQLKPFTWWKKFWPVQQGTLVLYNIPLLWSLCIWCPVFPLHPNKANLQLNIYAIRHGQLNHSWKTPVQTYLKVYVLANRNG